MTPPPTNTYTYTYSYSPRYLYTPRYSYPPGHSHTPLRTVLAALLATLLGAAAAHAQPSPDRLDAAAIARAAGFPGPLHIEEEATSELSKGFGDPVWAVGIASEDHSFGHAAVLLVRRGSFLGEAMQARLEAAARAPRATAAALQDDLRGQLERATHERDRARLAAQLAELQTLAAHGPLTRRMRLPRGRVGYLTVLGFAAGGATSIAAIPSPDGNYELLVIAGASLEGEPRIPTEASAAYERTLREQPLTVTRSMARVIDRELFPER